uniref:Uncharacterized protein n=1 Tax=Anguilla anguilla TaxID=7936 RepID=A0A0E9SSP3_ANGAN
MTNVNLMVGDEFESYGGSRM